MRFALLGLLLAVLPLSAQDVLIETESELREFASGVNGGTDYSGQSICLACDITLSDGAWTPIGTSANPFNGHFEGWGHVIGGLSINAGSSDYQGLFGYVAGGSIHDVAVTSSGSITGHNYVGGICGYLASGEILSCYTEITVSGASYVGGICGKQAGGKIKDCYVRGDVDGTPGNYLGAIVGGKTGTGSTLKNCLYDDEVIMATYAIGNDENYGSPYYDDSQNYVMPFADLDLNSWESLNDETNNMVWDMKEEDTYPQLRSFLKNEPLTFTFTPEKHWLTVCPNGNYSVPAGMEAYIVSEVGADYVRLSEVTTLNEGRGALLYSPSAGEFVATSTVGELDDYSADMWLKGSHVSPIAVGGTDKNDYVLSNGKFIRSQSGQLARGKAYLCLPISFGVKPLLNIMTDDETGIEEMEGSMFNGQRTTDNGQQTMFNDIYDLSGRKSPGVLNKGIYIIKGEKVKR